MQLNVSNLIELLQAPKCSKLCN